METTIAYCLTMLHSKYSTSRGLDHVVAMNQHSKCSKGRGVNVEASAFLPMVQNQMEKNIAKRKLFYTGVKEVD